MDEKTVLTPVGFEFQWSEDGMEFHLKIKRAHWSNITRPLSVVELIEAFRAFWIVFEDQYSNTIGGEQ